MDVKKDIAFNKVERKKMIHITNTKYLG